MRNKANIFDVLLGRRLRTVRRRRRYSQQWVGKHLGITFQQIQKYETGASRLTVEYLVRLCFLYHIPLTALIPTAPLLPATLVEPRAVRAAAREMRDGGADADHRRAAPGSNDGTVPEMGRELPEPLPTELRTLERALANLQYTATIAEPLDRDEAVRCVVRLDRVREQVADLARFIERRLGSPR